MPLLAAAKERFFRIIGDILRITFPSAAPPISIVSCGCIGVAGARVAGSGRVSGGLRVATTVFGESVKVILAIPTSKVVEAFDKAFDEVEFSKVSFPNISGENSAVALDTDSFERPEMIST